MNAGLHCGSPVKTVNSRIPRSPFPRVASQRWRSASQRHQPGAKVGNHAPRLLAVASLQPAELCHRVRAGSSSNT